MIRWWIITHVISTERSSSHCHLFCRTPIIRCLPILSMRSVFSWVHLCSGSFSPQLIMLKIVTNSFPFGNLSTSLIRTHSSMDRLTFLPSTIEKVGTYFVNPTGTFSNPIVISITTHFRVFMCQHTQFTSMLALFRCFIGWPFLVGTTHTSYPTLAIHHWQKVFGERYRPYFFLFNNIKLWAPSGCDKRLLRESMKILNHTFFVSDC